MKGPVKRILRTITAAVLLLCAMPQVYADNTQESSAPDTPELVEGETISDGIIVYTKSRTKGCVYVTACEKNLTDLSIPNEVYDYKVVGIYDGAFAGITSLTSVKLGTDLEYLGSSAFYGCSNLAEITLPEKITHIPYNCFASCGSLRKIELPESVVSLDAYSFAFSGLEEFEMSDNLNSIGPMSFSGCENLKEFRVSDNNSQFEVYDGILYSNDKQVIEAFPAGKELASFDVPESVAYIQPGAFYRSKLEQITMTNNVQWIGATAFSESNHLKSVVLSDKIAKISEGTFSDCTALKSITIPESVTVIGDMAFFGCNALKSIAVPDSVTSIGKQAFGITDDMGDNPHKIADFRLRASRESAAGKYARENKLSIDYTDGRSYTPFIIAGIAVVAVVVIIAVFVKKKSSSEGDSDDNDDDDEYREECNEDYEAEDSGESEDNEADDAEYKDYPSDDNDESYNGSDT